jgi:hypothetical protein
MSDVVKDSGIKIAGKLDLELDGCGKDIFKLLDKGKEQKAIQCMQELGDNFDPNMEKKGLLLWCQAIQVGAYEFLKLLIKNPKFHMNSTDAFSATPLMCLLYELSNKNAEYYNAEKIIDLIRDIINDKRTKL